MAAASAAAGFIIRSLEAMLKECMGKKYPDLHSAVQTCLDNMKETKQELTSDDHIHATTLAGDESIGAEGAVAVKEGEAPVAGTEKDVTMNKSEETSVPIMAALASAGHTLDRTQAELVLKPLRLAFEMKNIKLLEPALDCLHKLIAYDHLEGDPGLEGGKNASLFTDVLNMVCGCVDNSSSDSTILQVLKVLLTAVSSTRFRVHGEPLLGVIRVCYNIALNSYEHADIPSASYTTSDNVEMSRDEDEKTTSTADALSMSHTNETSPSFEELQNLAGGADIKGLEAVLDQAVQLGDGKKISRGIDLDSMSVVQRDALLLFRTLCKMGMKEESDEVTTKTRLLSLELLQGLLEGVNQSFTKNFHFIDSVKAYLSYALLRASVSSSPAVFQHATGIFAVLLLRFRESLKGEIGVFFPLIILKPLESNESALGQRTTVLRMLEKVCKDSQMLADIFVNYDCDLQAPNLFELMVNALSRIAQGTLTTDPSSVGLMQVASAKGSSLQCLVSLLKSLVDWEKLRREFVKHYNIVRSPEDDVLARESVTVNELKNQDDGLNQFEKAKAHKSTMEAVILEFNRKPAKGIELLLSNKLVEDKASAIAQFLKCTPSLDKVMIGEYLGQHEELPLAVMHAYVDSMKFSGLKFDIAIREFLKGFRLPGEAQKIDRIMEKFAERASKSSRLRPETEERGHLVNILNLALPKKQSEIDTKAESENVKQQIQALFKNKGEKRGVFYTAQRVELVRPMLEAVGWPLLAAFSVTMEETDNKPRVILCMEGFRAGIHLTRVLGIDTLRYAFLTSLVRFTFLHAPKEMRGKNVEALRTLLVLCDTDTESLQDTWNAVLECVSRLEYITSTPSIAATVMQGSNQISKDAILQSLRELAGKPAEQAFVNSVKLPSDSIVEFFTALCGVSAEELKQAPARVFSLQKLVEISYYNMARIRLVWARIWSVLAQHFIAAGSHHEEKVAMYAIDSLRQLGMKYLERAELTNFTFQNDILKPFVILMRNSPSEKIRSLIVDCIVQMIKSKVGSIKSGWRSVFMIFTAAADDDFESIVESAFENVEQVILEHFDQVVGDCFMDCVNSLIRFANNKVSPRISLKAIALLRICEDRLAEGFIPGGALKPLDGGLETNFDITEHYWFPMLAGLSDLTLDPRLEVRNCALEVLFDLLNERGQKFSSAFWESIFHRVLFPIFDHVRHAGRYGPVSSGDEWLRETSIHSLQLLCNLFNTFYKEVCFMLPPLLDFLLDCAKKTDQSVVCISLGALVHLVEVGGHQFGDSDWDTLLKSIRDASYETQPLELLNSLGFEEKNQAVLSKDLDDKDGDSPFSINHNRKEGGRAMGNESLSAGREAFGKIISTTDFKDDYGESNLQTNLDESDGLPSPPGNKQKPAVAVSVQRSQTFGQRIMGNMMDNLLLRSFTSKSKNDTDDLGPVSPVKILNAAEPVPDDYDEENSMMQTIKGKCITQLLLLSVIDSIQRKYWSKLKVPHKIAIMDILLSLIEFAASYNSSSNLILRMQYIPSERLPLNLLRQEITGTSIYLEILHKSTAIWKSSSHEQVNSDGPVVPTSINDSDYLATSDSEEKLKGIAEEKLVSFCGQILKETSELKSSTVVEMGYAHLHRVLDLRAPVIVKVLKRMCCMDSLIFRKHLREFYPLITKLVCCDQMDIRGALGDLFSTQLAPLLR
ncbi:hypothetical protein C4D60_Mb04t34760 [Musa balbisiana]|uniref:SEC7 domain-containing protein n=1 Tax=Musa balbisiana TaxID=52838 RepID=A0A4S8KH04_MUSBA|nr:hypothetical protein C4D60_Mb04t34760 [Musa balbisiana]